MSDHTITACCLNMEALLREAVGLLPAEPDWKGRVIAELNRPPATPAPQPTVSENTQEHGITCNCRRCSDYWDADHSALPSGPSTPAPQPPAPPGAGEGPYKVEWSSYPLNQYLLSGPGLERRMGFTHAEDAEKMRDTLQRVYAAGAASRQPEIDALRERVKAMEEVIRWAASVDGSRIGDTLRAALNPPASGGGGANG